MNKLFLKMKLLKITKILLLSFSVFFSPFLQAADSPEWVKDTKILRVTVQPNGNIYITLEKAVPNLGCKYHAQGILQLDTGAPHFDEQYSLILSTFMAGENINTYVQGCGDAYPYAQNTYVSK